MRLRLHLFLLLAFSGCSGSAGGPGGDDDDDDTGDDDGSSGSVDLDALTEFGGVKSASWMRQSFDSYELESIALSNLTGLCDKMTSYGEAYAAYQHAYEDIDPEDFCAEMKDPAVALVDSLAQLYGEGAAFVSVGLDADAEFDAATYDIGGTSAAYGSVSMYTSDYAVDFQDWDEGVDPTEDPNCGMDAPDDDRSDEWAFDSGELVIDALSEGAIAEGSMEGTLLDEDDVEDGDLSATFSATWCEVAFY